MPKAQNFAEKYINGIKVDKEDDIVAFNDEQHLYFNKTTYETYTSVTQILNQYSQEFDSAFWSSYKALEKILSPEVWSAVKKSLLATKKIHPKLITKLKIDEELFKQTQAEILAEYDRKREEACSHGTEVHLRKELAMYGKNKYDFRQYGFKDLCGEFECIQNHNILDLDRGVYPEFLISADFDGLMLVGQADIIISNGNDIYVGDYKTNKKIDSKSYYDPRTKKYVMMKPPLSHLMDCSLVHYQLQLSCYARMLQQRNPDLNIVQLQIIHIDHDNEQHLYTVDYLKEDVEKMIAHYRKQLKIKHELDNLKPVIK